MNDNIIPIFSIPLGTLKISERMNFFNIKNYEFKKNYSEDANNHYFITKSKKILDDYPEEKKIILNYINLYLKGILKYTNIDFSVTSSWATKLEPNSYSYLHNHKNCYLTGVLYFDDFYDSKSGLLEIHNPYDHLTSYEFFPSEINELNTKTISIIPEKNLLVLFPSYLKHSTSLSKSKNNRYSIAFNVIPVGTYGYGDNIVTISCI
jgi:hypothetical protein